MLVYREQITTKEFWILGIFISGVFGGRWNTHIHARRSDKPQMSGIRRRDFVHPPIFKKNVIWFQNHASILDFFRGAAGKRAFYRKNLRLVECNLSAGKWLGTWLKSGRRKAILSFEFEKDYFVCIPIKYMDTKQGLRGFPLSYWRLGDGASHARKFVDQVRHIYEKRDFLNFLAGTIPHNNNNNQSAVFRFLHHTLSEVHLVRVIFGFL